MQTALSCHEIDRSVPYQAALRAVGLTPVIFAPDHPGSLDAVSGLVLMGGHDVDPRLYGQAAHPKTQPPDRAHDDYEIALLRAALARHLPVLAICRGMQLLNVALDGTLVQHLPGTSTHQQRTGGHPVHDVVLEPSWEPLFQASRLRVNSRHHQAVDQPGKGVLVTGRNPDDDVIEAIAVPVSDSGFVAGVQWHPEDMIDDPVQLRLFQAFADALAAAERRLGTFHGPIS